MPHPIHYFLLLEGYGILQTKQNGLWKWQQIKKDKDIPHTLDELTELPGIGRKSANVIKRETGAPAGQGRQ